MKTRVQIDLHDADLAKLDKLKNNMGINTRSMTLRLLIRKKKIRSKIPSDIVALASIVYLITASMETILSSEFTRGQVKEWMKSLIKASKEVNRIMAKYDKH